MTPRLRTFTLTTHITVSVGWLGAVAAFLVLAVTGFDSTDTQIMRAVYLSLELVGWYLIVPLAFGSLATGLVMALGTPWGLFRHYWVLAKFLLTVGATGLLLIHMRPVGLVADAARAATLSGGDLWGVRVQLVVDATAALVVLLVNTILSVYKPGGLTPYGRRRRDEALTAARSSGRVTERDVWTVTTPGTPRWVKAAGIITLALVALFVILHLTGRGLGGH